MAAKEPKRPAEPRVTDIVWKKKKGQWYKIWLDGKKEVRKEKFDQPYSD